VTKYPDLFAALAAPFADAEVKVRAAQGGRSLAYVTARTVMNRMDAVLGPEGWWDTYTPREDSVECHLTIVLPDGNYVTKVDAGAYAGMADSGDDDKSGYSDAFKRAAAKFGVGRYLYGDGSTVFTHPDGEVVHVPPLVPDGVERRHEPSGNPSRPHDRPAARQDDGRRDNPPRESRRDEGRHDGQRPPQSGKALFAWVKQAEEKHGEGLLKYLNKVIKESDFPPRMVDLSAEEVAIIYAEALRAIESKDRGAA